MGTQTQSREDARADASGIPRAERIALTRAMECYSKGNSAAFGLVYDLIAPRLHGFLLRRTRAPDEADDLLQETMLRVHRSRGQFIPGADVIPWAFAIARRLFIDFSRHQRIEQRRAESEAGKSPEICAEGSGEEHCIARQLAERTETTYTQLPEIQRSAYQLVRVEGLSLGEAAQVLGTTVMAVKLRIRRAELALRTAACCDDSRHRRQLNPPRLPSAASS